VRTPVGNRPSHANQPEPMTAKRMQCPEAVLPFDPSVANGVTRPRSLDHRAASGGVGSWGGGAYTHGREDARFGKSPSETIAACEQV
jgi:hypothetical protein